MKGKELLIDGIDKEILRLFEVKSPLVAYQISGFVGISSSIVSRRLEKLEGYGIVKKVKEDSIRHFKRRFNNKQKEVKSPRRIFWSLDILDEN